MESAAGSVSYMNADDYLKQRVNNQLEYYEKEAGKAKRCFIRMQGFIIFLGLIVPVVVNLPDHWGGWDLQPYIKLAVTVMSLSLAILNGLLNFRKYGDLWLSYRMTEELLKHEKFLFVTRAGRYSEPETALSEFAQVVESILSAENNKFRSLIEDAKRPAIQQKKEN